MGEIIPFNNDEDPPDDGSIRPDRLSPDNMQGGPIPLGVGPNFTFYYLSSETGLVESLSANNHTERNLCALAKLDWYRFHFKSPKGVPWRSVVSTLFEFGAEVGFYNDDRVRGRGAVNDQGAVILNLGNKLIAEYNGALTEYPTGQSPVPGSKNVYTTGRALGIELANPLSDIESTKYFELLNQCSWQSPDNAILMAGWAVIAPFCGALKYRPCMWLTGESGSGKTWILNNLILPAMGKMLVRHTIGGTEAGLRRDLNSDALPVWLNEAESKNQRQADTMSKMLELMRASSDPDAEIVMGGGPGGAVVRFKLRSMFLFTSVLTALQETADINRTVPIKLTKREDQQWFHGFEREVKSTIGPDFASRLLSRTMWLMPTILANIDTLTQALAEHMGDRRIADTLAPMLAGYASLRSTRLLTQDDAARIVASRPWLGQLMHEIKEEAAPDHERVYDFMLQQLVRTDTGGMRSIAELIDVVRSGDDGVTESLILRRYGLRVEGSELWIAKGHEQLNRIYRGSEFAGSKWGQAMLQHPAARGGAQKSFGSDVGQRYTIVVKLQAIMPVENVAAQSTEVEVY